MKLTNFLLLFLLTITAKSYSQSFEIRGVLPWHNFLSGPTAWNEEDYRKYLDACEQNNINYIGFHNYTGGGERYFNYVEPMIKIQYKNVLPETGLDHSGMSRWGYLPMKVQDFGFNTGEFFDIPNDAQYFGANNSITAKTNEERYTKTQDLMKNVLVMAHDRGIQMAMGFEFGVAPPEYASIKTNQDMYWTGDGSLVYNPFDPDAIGILYATIDNIIETYQGIDWICLWLNEHSMFGVNPEKALSNEYMQKFYDENAAYYDDEGVSDSVKFLGVWSQAYIQKAYDYIKRKAPKTKVSISGWGSEAQMALLLKGLDQTLPKDIVFSMLNPNWGQETYPSIFRKISKNRKTWAIPWLESDGSLWHPQPRVNTMRSHVKSAYEDGHEGAVAIHWRTEDIQLNWDTFAHFASNPKDNKTTKEVYAEYCAKELGKHAEKLLAPKLAEIDLSATLSAISSPVYYAYEPTWGHLTLEQVKLCTEIIEIIDRCITKEKNKDFISNLKWLRANWEFTLLLDEVGTSLKPAWELRNNYLLGNSNTPIKESIDKAKMVLQNAPVEQLLKVAASKIRSRGELGVLSSLNQRVWREYQFLSEFLEEYGS